MLHSYETISWTHFPAKTEFMDITPIWKMSVKYFTFVYHRREMSLNGVSFVPPKQFSIRYLYYIVYIVISLLLFVPFFVFFFSPYKATFVCTRTEESIPCEESEKYYSLNEEIGKEEENTEEETTRSVPVNADVEPEITKPFTRTSRILNRQGSSQHH